MNVIVLNNKKEVNNMKKILLSLCLILSLFLIFNLSKSKSRAEICADCISASCPNMEGPVAEYCKDTSCKQKCKGIKVR